MADTAILGIRDRVDAPWLIDSSKAFAETGLNNGNLVFIYAFNRLFGDNDGSIATYPWHYPSSALNALGKTLLLPCANNLGSHIDFDDLAKYFAELRSPIVAIGLGAQADSRYREVPEIPDGTLEWLRQIIAHAPGGRPNIGVRGAYTLKVLAHYGFADHAIVTGCPSLFINPNPKLGQQIAARAARPFARIAMAAGHPGWQHLSHIETSLSRLITETGGESFVQSPLQMVQLARGEADQLSEQDLLEARDYSFAGMEIEEFKSWSRRHFRAFFGVPEWMEALRTHDFVVGTRIHGVVLGLQAGIPGLCIIHDSRTRELCETMGVPFVMGGDVIEGLTLDDLRERFVFDADAFDANRIMLARRFADFLRGNALEPTPQLLAIAGG